MAISENDRHDAYVRRIGSPARNWKVFVGLFRQRLPLIGAVMLACAFLGLVYIALAAPKYVASGRMVLDPNSLQFLKRGIEQRSLETVAAESESQIQLLTSRTVFDRVIAREKLESDPLFGGRGRNVFLRLFAAIGLVHAVDPYVVALRQLERSVSVTRGAGSSVVIVNAATEDPETSARIVNAVMDAYIEDETHAQAEVAQRASFALDKRLEGRRARLREAEQRYETYRSEHGMIITNGQSVTERQVSELSDQITSAEMQINDLRATLAQIQQARGSLDLNALPEAFRRGGIEILRNRYAAARQVEANLSATLGPRHPDRVTAAMETAEARRLFDQAVQDMIKSTTIELERTRTALAGLKARIEASKKDLGATNEAAVRLRELEREVETNRAVYQALLVRSQELAEQQRFAISNTRIISRAVKPLETNGASPVIVLCVSALIGLVLGAGLAWLSERFGIRANAFFSSRRKAVHDLYR